MESVSLLTALGVAARRRFWPADLAEPEGGKTVDIKLFTVDPTYRRRPSQGGVEEGEGRREAGRVAAMSEVWRSLIPDVLLRWLTQWRDGPSARAD
jgi:hypothetical protein